MKQHRITYYTAPIGTETKQDVVIEAEGEHKALEVFGELFPKLFIKECTIKKK